MVSRRNFISITIMMLTLLCMFQLTQVYYEHIVELDNNEFLPEQVVSGINQWKPETVDFSDPELETRYILFFGDADGEIGHAVQQWCRYTKRELVTCPDLGSFVGKIGKNQEYVLVESACLDLNGDLERLNAFADAGISIVFCDLPTVGEISANGQLQQMLGIRSIENENMTATGIKVFSGFLVGGEVSYYGEDEQTKMQPEDLQMPWYRLNAGAQTYMVGLLDEQDMAADEITRENLPALMWSYSNGKNKIFAVNGDYMGGNTGVGFLAAIDAKLNDYSIYPIVNAQMLTVANYPGLANENGAEMHRIFSSGMVQAGRDVVFPQLVATADQTGFVLTCMLQMQHNYLDFYVPEVPAFRSYLQLMKIAGAEMGLSLESKNPIVLEQKLEEDLRFLEVANSSYKFGSVYTAYDSFEMIAALENMPDSVSTVVSALYEELDLVSFGNDRLTIQTITGDACDYSFRSDLYMRSVQTALGYTNVLLDLNRVFWPQEGELSWELLSKQYSDNLYTNWKDFQVFEDTTVSQSDQKIRQLLTLDYEHVRKGNVIYLDLENLDQTVSFVLRIHNMEPEYISGGTWVALEDGMYLVTVTAPSVQIHLTDSTPIRN